jgi:DASH complex subunit ASK1
MRRELRGDPPSARGAPLPSTPGRRPPALPDMSMTPAGSSPFAALPPGTGARAANKDTILHQGVLGRTYRVAATPLTAQRSLRMFGGAGSRGDSPDDDDDDDDEEPQLRAEIFSSPVRAAPRGPAPGTSVLTPRRRGAVERRREERRRSSRGLLALDDDDDDDDDEEQATRGRAGQHTARSVLGWASDGDDDSEGLPEMSPPKTMRFDFGGRAVIQTPAREASRRIVHDLVYEAGGDMDEEDGFSPSIIVKDTRFQDDTF